MAKGAREGFSKNVTNDEAVALRRARDGVDAPIPLRETEDQAWERIYDMIYSLVREAVEQKSNNNDAQRQPCSHLFFMTHSGILRIFLRRLLGQERLHNHPNAKFDATGLFYLPNTSVTILDVRLVPPNPSDPASCDDEQQQQQPQQQQIVDHNLQVDIVELTWADHLGQDSKDTAYAE